MPLQLMNIKLKSTISKYVLPLMFLLLLSITPGAAATFTVISTADSSDAVPGDGFCDSGAGVCTLRAALEEANASAGTDTVAFNIPGTGVQTIAPLAPLPNVTDPIVIDGYTQPGAMPNTNPTTMGSNAVLLIEINGANAGAAVDGLRILGGNSTLRGLVINRFSDDGIAVNDGDGNTIAGNFIGTDATGTIDLGNLGDGFVTDTAIITVTSTANTIGGTAPADRNVISGNNQNGIDLFFSSNNRVLGNIVGLAADGVSDLGNNESGVLCNFGSNNAVGGPISAARNVLSGNRTTGLLLQAGGGSHLVQGNYIGTDVTGTLDVGNDGDGIGFNVRSNDVIGGANPGEGNLISGNGGDGLQIGNSNTIQVSGNLIGTTADGVTALGNGGHGIFFFATGATSEIGSLAPNVIAFNGGDGVFNSSGTGNRILRNAIHSNVGLGIDLGANGVTANDAGDADTGPNNLQNFPVLISSFNSGSGVSLNGSLNSAANAAFTIDFYAAQTCDASGNGEGQIYLGSIDVTTDGTGSISFAPFFSASIPLNYRFTATATDAANNTSEFSPCASVPTASAVVIGGRATTTDGRAVSRARVYLTDQNGFIRQAATNSFGFYQFAEVPAGSSYVLSGWHKNYRFVPQIVFIADSRNDLEITIFEAKAEPLEPIR